MTGQDGSYMANLLLHHGWTVVGTTRDRFSADLSRLDSLLITDRVKLLSLSLGDLGSVIRTIDTVKPDWIINLAGLTSVALSYQNPCESYSSIYEATLNILEAIRLTAPSIRFFNAGSTECFGNQSSGIAATEETAFRPASPYAIAKSASCWLVASYRSNYGLYCCTGITSNHESPLRGSSFVTQKIISQIRSINNGTSDQLTLHHLDVYRDWGWAPEYVKAIYHMLSAEVPDDYIIATGTTSSLRQFVSAAFKAAGLMEDHYKIQTTGSKRPSDINYSLLNPSKIRKSLNWISTKSIEQIACSMLYRNYLLAGDLDLGY